MQIYYPDSDSSGLEMSQHSLIYLYIYCIILEPRRVPAKLNGMSSSIAAEEAIYKLKVTDFTSIRFFVFVALCLFGVSRYVLKAIKYRVRIEKCQSYLPLLTALTHGLQADVNFGELNGCKPPAFVLSYKWPLALDIVKRGFKAGRQKKLLSLFTEYFDQLGPTVELTILGGTGFATMDPENVEAVLSTRFDGTSSYSSLA